MNELPGPAFPWFRLLMTGIVFVVFVAGVTARSSLGALHVHERRTVLDVHALSDGGALLLWEEPSGYWIARIDSNREHWRRQLPGVPRHISANGSGIGVANSLVLLQYTHPQRQSYDLLGLELSSGALRWTVFIESPPFSETTYERERSPIASHMYARGNHVIVESDEGWKRIDPRTGNTVEVFPDILRFEVADGVVHTRFVSQAVKPGLYDRGVRCTISSSAYRVLFKHLDDVRGDILLRSGDESEDILVANAGVVRSCAEYEGNIVLYSEEDATTRIRIVTRDGITIRDFAVPGRISHDTWNRDLNVLANRLPRFLLASVWDGGEHVHVIDLLQGAIVRTNRDADLLSIERTDQRWIHSWWEWKNARAIEIVDSQTGVTIDRIAVSLGVETDSHQIGGGYLWVFEKYANDLTFARIELSTARVDLNHGRMWIAYPKPKAQ